MAGEPFYCLGQIAKPHGNKGHLLVNLDTGNPTDLDRITLLYLDLDGEMVPFATETLEVRNNGKAVLRLEDVITVDDAERFAGKKIFIPVSALPEPSDNKFYFHEVTGFTVCDKQLGAIGTVAGVLEMQYQSLLQVKDREKEILIPIVEAIVRKIDRKKRIIYIDAPGGLIGLYR